MGYIIEIINALLEVFVVLFFFRQTLKPRPQSLMAKWFTILGVSALHIARSFIPFPTYMNFALTFILWGLFLIFLFKDTLIRKFVMMAIYFIVLIVCDMLSRFITASILDIPYNTMGAIGLQRYLIMLVNMILFFAIISPISLILKKRKTSISLKYWIMLLLFPLFSMFIVISADMLMVLAKVNDIKYIFLLLIIIIGLLYFNTVVFEFIDSYSAKLQLKITEELIEKQSENYHLLEMNEKDLRFLRHDINKHMAIMQDMIDNNRISKTQELMTSLENLSALPLGIVYTNDITLDSILNVECKKATELNIKYLVKAHQMQEPLNIAPADKSTILCNALDNAIEASSKTQKKFIVVDISSDDEHIKICIENSSQPVKVKRNSIFTTKKDSVNHGLGISSIKRTIDKYNGRLNITHSKGITRYTILLNNPKK